MSAAPVISDVHRAYLNDHAVSDAVIEAQGIRSEGDDIVFTWREGSHVTEQRRPWPGQGGVYYWTAGADLHLNVARDPGPDATILLCEGTKQHLAVASWAPPEYAVYGMPGCYGWTMSRKLDLAKFAGRNVLIMLDADAAENLDVYEAGARLASELEMEEPPGKASFIPSPAWGKDGIDDYLGRMAAERRTDRLAKLIARAQDKPADRKPTKRKAPDAQPDSGGQPVVVVNKRRRDVIREVLAAMKGQWDARELFCYGGVTTRLRDGTAEPLSKGAYLRWLSEGVATYKYTPPTMTTPGRYEDCWPDAQTVEALMASAEEFAPLHRIVRMPFIRSDGTVCAKNGYDWDEGSRPGQGQGTFVAMGNSGMDRLDIPDAPSRADAAAAARWLLEEWLGDMPFKDPSSRAQALALMITPFIRGLVPLVPLAVISGLQIGVGKNLLADCLSIMMTGQPASPLQWIPDDDDEVRKQILSAFRQGDSLLIFDEAHDIGGAALSRALTAQNYTDRVLGASQMASYPNKAVWVALGNQVKASADMSRRNYRIDLYPPGPDPQDRPESAFRHPDLRGWTAQARPEIITALLVVIRSWFAAGCPAHSRGSLMGSFEAWDKMLSGILAWAGVPGFLTDLIEKRNESDFAGGYWTEHLAWLHGVFGTQSFGTVAVKRAAIASADGWSALPGLDSLTDPGFARKLGQEYARHRDQWAGQLRLTRVGKGFNNVAKWQIESLAPPDLGEGERRGNGGGTPYSSDPPGDTPVSIRDMPPDLGEGEQDTREGEQLFSDIPFDLQEEDQRGNRGNILTPPVSAHAGAHAGARVYAHVREEGQGGVPLIPPVPPDGAFAQVTPSIAGPGEAQAVPPAPVSAGQEGYDGTGTLIFDLEGASAKELFTYQPYDEAGFIRLAAVAGPAGEPAIVGVRDLVAMLDAAPEISGHNIMGFDLLALARHHGADYDRLAAKAVDTELIARQANPPRSRDTHNADSYGLDDVARGLGLPGKTDDLKRLRQLHGGYDKIPLDDPQYRSYLEGDVRASAAVLAAMRRSYGPDPYVAREHSLAALAGRMTLSGFRVDTELLSERLRAGEERKQQALGLLHDRWGLPLTKAVMRGRGEARAEHEEPVKSPLATDTGRAWLAAQYERYQVPDPPRTAKAGKLALGAEDLKPLLAQATGSLREMLELMAIVTTTRTVYQTAADSLTADGRVHPFNSFRQASGRWSVTNPGLTVFGKRSGRNRERDIFIPDPGHVLLCFDLSQVDMRAMAGHCQDRGYMAMFAPGRDAHAEIAAQVGISRQDAKAIGHGWNYGLGVNAMVRGGPGRPPLDEGLVRTFVAGMEERFPVLIAWREEIRERGAAGDVLDNGFGRRMACDPGRAYTVAPALMGQGGARDIMGQCLLNLDKSLWPLLRVMVHDEIVVSCPKEDAVDVARQFIAAMTWTWRGVPIVCDMTAGMNWGTGQQGTGK